MNSGSSNRVAWRRRVARCAVSVAAVVAATSAHAQTPYWLDGITILATKTEERAIDALAAISTLNQQQIQERAPTRPAQIFTGLPGVSTEASAQDPGSAVNIRGMQDFGRVAVIVDGARQNFARAGHNGAGSYYLEPETLAGVEIARGPVSNIFGSGAIGGVVSFRTKDVDDILRPGEQWGAETFGEIGSNRFNGIGSYYGAVRAGPNAEFIAGGTFRHLDAYKDGDGNVVPNSGQQFATGLGKATFRPADGHEVKFGGLHYDATWRNQTNSETSGILTSIRDSHARNSTATAKWSYDRPDDRLWNFSHSGYWNRVDVDTLAVYVDPGSTGFYGNIGNRAGYQVDTLGYDGHNTSRFETGDFRHEFTVGGDIFQDDVQNFDQGGFGAGYNPSGQRRVWGSFAQLRTRYSTWLEIITALRYDNYSLDGVDSTGARVGSGGDRVSPKITVGISPLEWLTFYGTYAEGYRAPAVTETLISGIHPAPANFTFLPNPDLKPEIGKTKEFGINVKRDDVLMPGDHWRVKASVFRNDVDDFIDTETTCAFPIPPGPPGPPCFLPGFPPAPDFSNWVSQYQNVAKARIQGAELESIYDRGDWFLGLNAHYIRGKDLTEGDSLGKIPADMVAATFGLRSADRKWTAALRWAYYAGKTLADIPMEDTGTAARLRETTGSYNLVNLYMAYQPNENLTAALSVENMLNETYRIYTHEFNSPGVTVKGSLRVRFAGGVPPLDEERKNLQ